MAYRFLLKTIFMTLILFPTLLLHAFATDLTTVEKIYIGDMGASDEAARFKLLLDDKLSEHGFKVVDSPDTADAILSGALAVRVTYEKTTARATVRLKAQDGTRLWSGDFGPTIGILRSHDSVTRRAEDISDELSRVKAQAISEAALSKLQPAKK